MQSEETAKSSINVQAAVQFRKLGKRKRYRQSLDPRRKQVCVADYLLGDMADD